MYISQFRAVNVGPFSDLSLQLQRGSVGVFGKNGAGKSTLINLMYGLLTNDFKRFGELKADIVRNTAGDRSESYIEGQVCHNGQVLNITRNFKPTKAKPGNVLSVNDVRLTDANKIQEELNNRFGDYKGQILTDFDRKRIAEETQMLVNISFHSQHVAMGHASW